MTTNSVQPNLDGIPLFAVLLPDERAMLWQNAMMCAYSRHQVIYKPGHAAAKVYFLYKGTVKVAVHAEKKDIIKYVVRQSSLFGETCLTGDAFRRDFAYAMDGSVEVLELDAQTMLLLMKRNFAFAQSVLHFWANACATPRASSKMWCSKIPKAASWNSCTKWAPNMAN